MEFSIPVLVRPGVGSGLGLAAADDLVAISHINGVIQVYRIHHGELVYLKSLVVCKAAMGLGFVHRHGSLSLLAADTGGHSIHVLDVRSRSHEYVGKPGGVPSPRYVTGAGDLVAASCWDDWASEDHVVRVYQESNNSWHLLRVVGDHLSRPRGLRFSPDRTTIVVVDSGNGLVSKYQVHDGAFVEHVFKSHRSHFLHDVEWVNDRWHVVEDAVSYTSHAVRGSSCAMSPILGLVVRNAETVRAFTSKRWMTQDAMSPSRFAWMIGVARAIHARVWC